MGSSYSWVRIPPSPLHDKRVVASGEHAFVVRGDGSGAALPRRGSASLRSASPGLRSSGGRSPGCGLGPVAARRSNPTLSASRQPRRRRRRRVPIPGAMGRPVERSRVGRLPAAPKLAAAAASAQTRGDHNPSVASPPQGCATRRPRGGGSPRILPRRQRRRGWHVPERGARGVVVAACWSLRGPKWKLRVSSRLVAVGQGPTGAHSRSNGSPSRTNSRGPRRSRARLLDGATTTLRSLRDLRDVPPAAQGAAESRANLAAANGGGCPFRSPKSEVRSPKSEVRSPKSEVRSP